MSHEILVAGGGVAGLRTATSLRQHGAEHVTLVEKQPNRSSRTWFALKHRLPSDVANVVIEKDHSYNLTGTQFFLFDKSGKVRDCFGIDLAGLLNYGTNLMIDQYNLEQYLLQQAQDMGVSFVYDSIAAVTFSTQGFNVSLARNGTVHADTVIDATGPNSVLQRELGVLNDDPLVLWIYGGRMRGDFNPNSMIFPLTEAEIAGRLSWVTPWSANQADVVASDYCRLSQFNEKTSQFKRMFDNLVALCQKNYICNPQEMLQPIIGMIRVLPIRKPLYKQQIYAVGDAAGQACPNMAEGLTAALRLADQLGAYIETNEHPTPQEYHNRWYGNRKTREYPYTLAIATLLKRVMQQKAGGNAAIYNANVKHGDPKDKLRWLTERSFSIKDIPYLVLEAGLHPSIIFQVVELLEKLVLLNTRRYDSILWGE